jgi:hypothetical protein
MTYVRYEPAFLAGSGGDSYFDKKKFVILFSEKKNFFHPAIIL